MRNSIPGEPYNVASLASPVPLRARCLDRTFCQDPELAIRAREVADVAQLQSILPLIGTFNMSGSRGFQLVVIVACVVGLVACGSGQPDQETASSGVASATVATAPAAGQHYQASISLDGQPEVTADGKSILVTVRVTNTGTGIFGSATMPHPVNIGAHSIDPAGKIVNNDLARGILPQTEPGATTTATIQLPTDQLLGKRAEILPVLEAVSWFDQWSPPTRPLIVGPFKACSNATIGNVCDASGEPLAVASEHP